MQELPHAHAGSFRVHGKSVDPVEKLCQADVNHTTNCRAQGFDPEKLGCQTCRVLEQRPSGELFGVWDQSVGFGV